MSLSAFQDLGFGITCIDTELNRPALAACYLIRQGDGAALIDTGCGNAVPGVLAVLDHLGVKREQVCYVCPTHVHLDHAGGAGMLMEALPNATLIAHPRAAPHFIDTSKIRAGSAAVYGEAGLLKTFGEIRPVPAARVQVADDGFELDLNGRRLRFLDTPGHARHHYCVWDEPSRGIFSGDTFGISYREFDIADRAWIMPTTTPVQFEPEAWNTSLDRLLALNPQRCFLTHYGTVENIQELAATLRQGLNDYCELAVRYRESNVRHEKLVQGLTALSLRRLEEHGCTLGEARSRALLALDMELNAQGLGVWLDRQTKV